MCDPSLASNGHRRLVIFGTAIAALALLGSLLVGTVASPAYATTPLEISGTAEATSSVGTSIVAGDTFAFTFTLDLDSGATAPPLGATGSFFNNAVDAFALTAGSRNVGTWSPTVVNWEISPVQNLNSNPNSETLTLQVRAPNAPDINGVAFFDLGISLSWDSSVVDIQQVPTGTSLATALGTLSPDVSAALYGFEMRDAELSSAMFNAYPTPAESNGGAGDQSPRPILQQFGKPSTGTCDEAAPADLNWGGSWSGGWGDSWARWMNDGAGGDVCTRTLVYNNSSGRWNPSSS